MEIWVSSFHSLTKLVDGSRFVIEPTVDYSNDRVFYRLVYRTVGKVLGYFTQGSYEDCRLWLDVFQVRLEEKCRSSVGLVVVDMRDMAVKEE